MTLYEIFYPSFPSVELPDYYVFWYCFYYTIGYGILLFVGLYGYKKAEFPPDSLALFTIVIFSIGKFIYYIFIINENFPTYIEKCNSKGMALLTSLTLWVFAIIIWCKRYNINKLLKSKL